LQVSQKLWIGWNSITSKDIIFHSFQNLSEFRHVNYASKHANSNVKNVSLISPLYLLTYLISYKHLQLKWVQKWPTECVCRECVFKLFIQLLYCYLSEIQTMYDDHAQHSWSYWYTKIYEFSYTLVYNHMNVCCINVLKWQWYNWLHGIRFQKTKVSFSTEWCLQVYLHILLQNCIIFGPIRVWFSTIYNKPIWICFKL
jgi:hypothetical protein